MHLIHTIAQQQGLFCTWVSTPLKNIASHCAREWGEKGYASEQLTATLQESMKQLPQYTLCYLLSPQGVMLTPTISHSGCDQRDLGKDVSLRPYFLEWSEEREFFLSHPYNSTKTHLPCMTAMQAVRIDGELFAIIAIDFDGSSHAQKFNRFAPRDHTQVKGDPSIRQQLFAQTRTVSPMEEQIDVANRHAAWMLHHHGAFYAQLRYSRSTATIRFVENPYHDSIFTLDQLLTSNSPNRQPMSSLSQVSADKIEPVFALFKSLRLADENIYLRSGSLNVISAMVELNFSCDGTHYLPVDEFLEKSTAFWLDGGGAPPCDSTIQEHGSEVQPLTAQGYGVAARVQQRNYL
jgi:hypothetical protein